MSGLSSVGGAGGPAEARPASGPVAQVTLRSPTLQPAREILSGAPPLARGSRGIAVSSLQGALTALGHEPGAIDGDFGRRTEQALLAFQRASGIPASGRLDVQTLVTLDAKLADFVAARDGPRTPAAPAAPAGRVPDESAQKLKELRDTLRYMFRRDGPQGLEGKTLSELLGAAEPDPANGVLTAADVARLPFLSAENRTLLRNLCNPHGGFAYVSAPTRAMLEAEPSAAGRRAILSMDRDEVAGAVMAGDARISPQEVLDWKRTHPRAPSAGFYDRLLGAAIHRRWEPRPPLRAGSLPAVPATELRNDNDGVRFTPRAAFRPRTLDELSDVMRFAEETGRRLKPIGSLHSFSTVHVANDIVLEPQGLSFVRGPAELQREGDLRRDLTQHDKDHLVRVGSGTQIRTLNPELWEKHGLALPNMGGYDEQTLAGVVNTATHGSGLQFSSFADLVRSMDMVLPGGRKVRIEPRDGITDPVEFRSKHPDMELIQDDSFFDSAVCSMGSMGVVHSYVLGVRNKYHLLEKRTESTWEETRDRMLRNEGVRGLMSSRDRPEVPGQRFPARHFEILVNPHATNGSHTAILTTRKDAAEPRRDGDFEANNRNVLYRMHAAPYSRPWLSEAILSAAPNEVGGSTTTIASVAPGLVPGAIDSSLKTMTDEVYHERSYNVFNIGAANEVKAVSSEIAVPIRGDGYIRAMDALLAKAREFEAQGKPHTGPISIRFVKGSRATMSPQQEDVAMFEIIFTKDTPHAAELLRAYEDVLAPFGGRPHMGQLNFMTPEKTRRMYPKLDEWMGIRSALDPRGVMRNRFTDEALGVGRGGPP